ncbi:MAG: Ig domain-containing protein [Paludibacteraceae bacterium]|nr:Ig domain-containing protein [Paludibacteraceae bacterium]
MKKIFMILAAALLTVSMSAADLTGKRIYVNPGHGSYGPNDRPMATIPYPNLPTTGMPDTLGFYESNTNLWKCMYLGEKLEAMGATVLYSRTQCGPWPYEMKNGDYPDYTYNKGGSIADPTIGWQYSDGYYAHPDYEKYNRSLSEICREVEANNIDYFISVHSNANSEGSTANFPLMLYRGPDNYASANSVDGAEYVEGSYEKAKLANEEKLKIMKAGIDVPSSTNLNIRGDWNFYGSTSTLTINGKTYKGYLGVMKHGASGFLSEGYFHTYQPARHRALNQDYCHMEGLDYYRGIINYYGADKETVGYIVGTVKDQYNKMSHSLFTYTPKSNDQWVPCNGAEVILKKGGVEVARYNVDTMYNGIFVFEGLEPGDDYSLDANCDGFFPLADQYKVPFSVKANETTYPMIYLVDTTWTPPTIVYEDYPNPAQPAYLGLPSVFEMQQEAVRDFTEVIKGTVKRTLQSGDTTILLSHEEDGTPHIYLIKSSLNTIETISTDSILPRDPDNVGDYLALSDIALTCDGKLVGVNYVRCQYGDDQVDAGYKRGVKTFYIWDKLAGDARVWFTANDAGNSYRSDGGYTIAVKGESKDCQVIVSQRHYNATTGGALRISAYTVTDGAPSYIFYGKTLNAEAPLHAVTHGEDIQFTLSPRGEKKDFIFDAGLTTPMEFSLPGGQNQDVTVVGQVSADLMHAKFNGATYFKYAGHSLMAAPATDTLGRVTGVQVLDITEGLDKAVVVKTTNTTLAEAVEATYASASAKVKGTDLYLYLLIDNKMYCFTTVGVDQPVVASIMAMNLNVEDNDSVYTFTFNATADAKSANLVFYNKGGYVSGKIALANVVKGANTATVAKADLPGKPGQTLTWAVELEGETIANFGIIASDNSLIESGTSRLFNAVNTNPELDNFGKIYIMHRAGSSASANAPKSGIWEFDHNLVKQNTEVYKGGEEKFGNPTRMSMDREGYLYIADWADGHSGIFMANTADMTQPFTQFFAGTRGSDGEFNNGGVYTGSSTPGCYVYDNGEEVKLFVYNEDAAGTLPKNGMAVYNIGQEDGTILHSWETAPSAVYTLTGQANTEGNPWGTSHGFFVSQVRGSGNNNSGATSLKFYSNDGTEQMSSASDEYKEIITGSDAGGYVVSADESVMIFNDGDQQFLVFDITWEGDKPVMALRYTIKHGIATIRQMNWDYAGNIVCSGDNGIHIVSLPKDENVTVVPAKKALTVTCPGAVVPVTGVALDTAAIELLVEDTHTLTAIITPADATDNYVKWSSSDTKIATVNEGVVTAMAIGTATITATTVDGEFTATCQVTVKPRPVTSVALDKAEVTLEVKETTTLVATITPANATNQNVTWSTSDAQVATVENGVVTAVALGTATITVATEDGNLTATCVVTVEPTSVTGVTLDLTELALEVPNTATLTATVAPEDATDKSVVWASDNDAVATVADGVVTAVAEGTANITVTTVDGNFKATCVVTVRVADGVMNIIVLDKNAPMYDVLGRQVDDSYRGIVIQNGRKFMLQ